MVLEQERHWKPGIPNWLLMWTIIHVHCLDNTTLFLTNIHNCLYYYLTISRFFIQIFRFLSFIFHCWRLQFRHLIAHNFLRSFFLKKKIYQFLDKYNSENHRIVLGLHLYLRIDRVIDKSFLDSCCIIACQI